MWIVPTFLKKCDVSLCEASIIHTPSPFFCNYKAEKWLGVGRQIEPLHLVNVSLNDDHQTLKCQLLEQ